ncbi:MAG: glycosyltransferase family 2 protein [Candidatus Methanomethylicaceae archaeon]
MTADKISVVIPTCNRFAYLQDVIRSVQHHKLRSGDFEIIVVDNCPNREPHEVVEQTSKNVDSPSFYVRELNIGLHNGRHAGARHARGDILVYVDDDIIAAPGWLQAIAEAFEDPDVHLVGGRSLPQYEADPPDWLEVFWTHTPEGHHYCGYLSLVDLGDRPGEMDPNFVWGLNFAIRKQTLEMLGGFHPDGFPWELRRYRGDGETAVTRKAQALGLKAVYRPDALVYHRVPKSRLTVEYFERRAYLQGISDSFTAIRAYGGLPPAASQPASLNWKTPLRWAKRSLRRLLRPAPPLPPDPYQEIRDRVRAAYEAGYRYHQEEVRNDPTLLEWVLRPDYWDAAVPRQPEKGAK